MLSFLFFYAFKTQINNLTLLQLIFKLINMKTIKIITFLFILWIFFSCNSANKEATAYESQSDMAYLESAAASIAPDSAVGGFISSSAAVENPYDSSHSFIRTAELKFKVKNVIKSTYDIENIAAEQGGFVTYTHLSSSIDQVKITPVSVDSSLETTYFTVSNTLTIRVPNTLLDTTLRIIARNIDFLDYRTINAEDVRLNYIANELAQKRSAHNASRLSNEIDNNSHKLGETTRAEELLWKKKEKEDEAKIANMALQDKIKLSTITLIIYQRQAFKNQLYYSNENVEEYKPGFGSKIIESLVFGWKMLEEIVLFLVKIWAVLLLIAVAIFIYKKRGNFSMKRKK
jgi:hypothetical protein